MAEDEQKDSAPAEVKKDEAAKGLTFRDESPIVTEHEATVGGQTLRYHVTTGMMPLRDTKTDEILAQIFFMAYTLDQAEGEPARPLTFAFNGGPGSASIWLHMGALGPKRVKLNADGTMPPPPFRLIDNDDTWLTETDLVFVDPVGTGFSRAKSEEAGQTYWNYQGDIESVAEFIRLYLTRYGRWTSPLFLAGESYGTIRASGLSSYLVERGIAMNGVLLVSALLDYATLLMDDASSNRVPYPLYVPAFAATAWYHGRLADDLQTRELQVVIDEAEAWAMSEYVVALAKGGQISGEERQRVIQQLSRFTGLSEQYVDQSEMRVHIMRFCKELLRDQKQTVGRLDSRFTGRDRLGVTDTPDFDPSLMSPTPPFTAAFNDYVRNQLGFRTDTVYETLSMDVFRHWETDKKHQGYVETGDALRLAMEHNSHMRVLVTCGYYDLATPFSAIIHTIDQIGLPPSSRDRVEFTFYDAGHMMYIDDKERTKLKEDVARFIRACLPS